MCKSGDIESAAEIANKLPDEAKAVIPKSEWEKIHEHTSNAEKKKNIPDNEMFQTRSEHEMFDLTKAISVVDELVKGGKFKLQGTIDYQGLHIKVENRKGSVRKGTDPDGKEWKTKMIYPYGYISRTKAADDEHVDCFVGDDRESDKVFVVHQVVPETGEYDEDKVMLGFDSATEAKQAYLKHYDSPKFFGSMTEMTFERFKESLKKNKGQKLEKSY